jgi:aldose 1-epimerase
VNENNGADTLHGGTNGYDRRTWGILHHSNDTLVFGLFDPDGEQGFPGAVLSAVNLYLNKLVIDLSLKLLGDLSA